MGLKIPNACTFDLVLHVALLGIAENEKQIKCPLAGNWLDKLWNSHVMGYSAATKRKKEKKNERKKEKKKAWGHTHTLRGLIWKDRWDVLSEESKGKNCVAYGYSLLKKADTFKIYFLYDFLNTKKLWKDSNETKTSNLLGLVMSGGDGG